MARALLTALAIGLLLFAAGCGGASGDPGPKPRSIDPPSFSDLEKTTLDEATEAQIERFAKVRIPASATGLRSMSQSAMDTQVLVSFRLPAKDLEAFIDSGDFNARLTEGDRAIPTATGSDIGSEIGWRLGDIKHLKGLSDTGPGLGRNLIVALDDPQQPMIYLEAGTL